jgi:hypothetical protein
MPNRINSSLDQNKFIPIHVCTIPMLCRRQAKNTATNHATDLATNHTSNLATNLTHRSCHHHHHCCRHCGHHCCHPRRRRHRPCCRHPYCRCRLCLSSSLTLSSSSPVVLTVLAGRPCRHRHRPRCCHPYQCRCPHPLSLPSLPVAILARWQGRPRPLLSLFSPVVVFAVTITIAVVAAIPSAASFS